MEVYCWLSQIKIMKTEDGWSVYYKYRCRLKVFSVYVLRDSKNEKDQYSNSHVS